MPHEAKGLLAPNGVPEALEGNTIHFCPPFGGLAKSEKKKRYVKAYEISKGKDFKGDWPRPASRKTREGGVKKDLLFEAPTGREGASSGFLAYERQFLERGGRSLDFFCFRFCVKTKKEVGYGGNAPKSKSPNIFLSHS